MSSGRDPSKKPQITPSGSTPSRFTSLGDSIHEDDSEEPSSPAPTQQQPRPLQRSVSQRRTEYGTIPTSEPPTLRRVPTSQKKTGSSSAQREPPTSPSFPPLSPQPTRTQSRPSTVRRMSTTRHLPHRGEQFSVDDDPSEVREARERVRAERGSQNQDFEPLSRTTSTVRRKTQHIPQLARVESQEENEGVEADDSYAGERLIEPREELEPDAEEEPDVAEEDADLSDAESFTLRDRQLAINETHPFGIRIWKPALYKKNRSVEKNAEEDIHSSPSQIVSRWLRIFNCLWTILFGWWLALAALSASIVCLIFSFEPSVAAYGRVFWGLSRYLFWPFGQFVQLEQDQQYAEEDEGEGRSISEYERWQSGDLEYGRLMFGPNVTHVGSLVGRHRNSIDSVGERDSLLGRNGTIDQTETAYLRKRRLFGRGQWTLGRIIFFAFFYFLIAPLMLFVSLLCWLMVFWIPMGRVLTILFYHLRKRPLALHFHPDVSYARDRTKPSQIILCTYRAAGLKYWKYTIDGTNIFLINFLSIVVFVILDYFVLKEALHVNIWLNSPALMFILGLVSIIPLAYFIGQAVASISAQSSMGMGAAVNAFFSTIVEVYLYCVALNQGKAPLVEGSIMGSIFAGILLLPGLSMCFGAIKKKTQRFNVKSAGATSTMLLFAIITAFGPTLFYKIYGAHELICKTCAQDDYDEPRDCRQCYFRQVPAPNDDFFLQAVRPYCWFAAFLLFLSYIIGLLFTLRTHAAVIWSTDTDEKRPAPTVPTTDISPMDTRRQSIGNTQTTTQMAGSYVPKPAIRDSQLYKRILGQSLRSAGLENREESSGADPTPNDSSRTSALDHHTEHGLPHVVPPKSSGNDSMTSPRLQPIVPGLSEEQNQQFARQMAELAATAATVAARDAVQDPRRASYLANHSSKQDKSHVGSLQRVSTTDYPRTPGTAEEQTANAQAGGHDDAAGGHDAPNWSRTKSSIILLTATFAYAMVAEILVDTVDVVLSSVTIDEKFLGITLFALVPNTTEFLNAISFAMNGNIALSMEIGSAYTLQVALLQIPTLVAYSAVRGQYIDPENLARQTFNLIFPQWDMVTVILCVLLLSYMYSEGKSNYFKGSILVLTYLVIVMGFYFSGFTGLDVLGVDPDNTLAIAVSQWDSLKNSRPPRRGREL